MMKKRGTERLRTRSGGFFSFFLAEAAPVGKPNTTANCALRLAELILPPGENLRQITKGYA
ncbi:MAG TPA: hypothetical protein VK657_04700 [Terriglobales bacterium]|nr:hypothetical protein [Terriglobales bacterium]